MQIGQCYFETDPSGLSPPLTKVEREACYKEFPTMSEWRTFIMKGDRLTTELPASKEWTSKEFATRFTIAYDEPLCNGTMRTTARLATERKESEEAMRKVIQDRRKRAEQVALQRETDRLNREIEAVEAMDRVRARYYMGEDPDHLLDTVDTVG